MKVCGEPYIHSILGILSNYIKKGYDTSLYQRYLYDINYNII